MKKYRHKTFLQIPGSDRFNDTIDKQLTKFFCEHPYIDVINIAYNQGVNHAGIYISTTAWLLYCEYEKGE